MNGPELALVNISTGVVSVIFYAIMLLVCVRQYKYWKFVPVLVVGAGMCILGTSSLIDIIFRYSPETTPIPLVDLYLRMSGVLFYIAALLVIRGLLGTQARVPWDRLLVYAVAYGAMCMLYMLPAYVWVEFDIESGMWFVMSNTAWFVVLNLATSLPAMEIVYILLRRIRAPDVSRAARHALRTMYVGFLIPVFGSLIIFFLPNYLGAVLSNITLTLGAVLIVISFARNPLVLSFSSGELYRLILCSSEDSSLSIASYDWLLSDWISPELTSAALSGTSILMDEITRQSANREELSRVKLESREVLIERSEHFVGYLIVQEPDRICQIALRRLVYSYEEQYGPFGGAVPNQELPKEEFITKIQHIFTFVPETAQKVLEA